MSLPFIALHRVQLDCVEGNIASPKHLKEVLMPVKISENIQDAVDRLREAREQYVNEVEIIMSDWEGITVYPVLGSGLQEEWLQDNGCVFWKYVAISNYDGYGRVYVCPSGTDERFQQWLEEMDH